MANLGPMRIQSFCRLERHGGVRDFRARGCGHSGPRHSTARFLHSGSVMKSVIVAVVAITMSAAGLAADPPVERPAPRRPKAADGGAEQPIADLIAALKDPTAGTRRQAANHLGGCGAKAATAVPALIAALKEDKEPAVRASVAEALGGIGKFARAAVPGLLAALKDTDALVRETAAEALADINADAKTVVPALVKLLGDPDRDVRCAAATAIGDFGVDAREAVPELKKALKDKHPFVREAAADALKAIDLAGRKLDS